jgi:hypothetical protein
MLIVVERAVGIRDADFGKELRRRLAYFMEFECGGNGDPK